jgi:hypothetical protein
MKKFICIVSFIFVLLIIGCGKQEPEQEQITAKVIADEVPLPVVEPEILEEVEEITTTVKLCFDTDNGIIRWEAGSIFGFTDKAERYEFYDYCIDRTHVSEYYCENEEPRNETHPCSNGCVDSHCL